MSIENGLVRQGYHQHQCAPLEGPTALCALSRAIVGVPIEHAHPCRKIANHSGIFTATIKMQLVAMACAGTNQKNAEGGDLQPPGAHSLLNPCRSTSNSILVGADGLLLLE